MPLRKFTILGAGLSGLSASYHLGHENCMIFEQGSYPGGHIHSYMKDGFTWDEGPHVSFTKNDYVKNLFYKSVEGELFQFPAETVNYFYRSWIPHPAQSNLYAIPQPLRDKVLGDFLGSRNNKELAPKNYMEWLIMAFGESFYNNFPRVYTKKYWTTEPEKLTTDWIGERIFPPNIDDVIKGCYGPLERQTHYITEVRYPKIGGYFSFGRLFIGGANIQYNKQVVHVCFKEKRVLFSDGTTHNYEKLISTIPLPTLIEISDAPNNIKESARQLNCSSLLLVNVVANHPTIRKEKWMYVYDENKYSTRLYCTEGLSSNNGLPGKTGIQVEVYFSKNKPKNEDNDIIAKKVCDELVEMGLIKSNSSNESIHTKWVPWANVIFDHQRKENQDIILHWLEQYGLSREKDDLNPMTNWNDKEIEVSQLGNIILAGRFGQWKYFWTDDCILRGNFIKTKLF